MSIPIDLMPEVTPDPLTLVDRCDRCGAQAFVRAFILTETGLLPLLFCAHHYTQNADALTLIAAVIQDESDRVNNKPGG